MTTTIMCDTKTDVSMYGSISSVINGITELRNKYFRKSLLQQYKILHVFTIIKQYE